MTAVAESIRQQVGTNIQRDREIRMYGCTEADLRESVETSFTFKTAGPAMIAAGLMSDAQEEIAMGLGESARKTLNRAKWVLFEYLDRT
jgi:hypothetical protein